MSSPALICAWILASQNLSQEQTITQQRAAQNVRWLVGRTDLTAMDKGGEVFQDSMSNLCVGTDKV